jgi:hypothetical protein
MSLSWEVMCVCGQLLRGERQRRHQVVPCSNCGRKVFVLPRSLLDAPEEVPEAPPVVRSWRKPALVGAGSVLLLLVGFLIALPYLSRKQPDVAAVEAHGDAKALLARIEGCRQLMGQGKFHLAKRCLEQAIAERDRRTGLLTGTQNLWLNQLQRQADLLARLSPVPLEEIARAAMLVRDAEERSEQLSWFRGRSFIFDDKVRRDADDPEGRWLKLASYVVEVDDKAVRLALEELVVLQDLPLDEGPRLIFGARFAGCEPERAGDLTHTGWVIRFAPESAVLFTDIDALEAGSPVSLGRDLKEALQRQQEWLSERGAALVLPARP